MKDRHLWYPRMWLAFQRLPLWVLYWHLKLDTYSEGDPWAQGWSSFMRSLLDFYAVCWLILETDSQEYVKTDPTERDPNSTAIITVNQAQEPDAFTALFDHWDANLWEVCKLLFLRIVPGFMRKYSQVSLYARSSGSGQAKQGCYSAYGQVSLYYQLLQWRRFEPIREAAKPCEPIKSYKMVNSIMRRNLSMPRIPTLDASAFSIPFRGAKVFHTRYFLDVSKTVTVRMSYLISHARPQMACTLRQVLKNFERLIFQRAFCDVCLFSYSPSEVQLCLLNIQSQILGWIRKY